MARQKNNRFQDNLTRPNVLEDNKENYFELKGNWNKIQFPKSQPITLELACGRGEYSIGLAKLFPDRNFVGVDVKGDRMWVGSTQALEEGLDNVMFLRALIQNIEQFFAENEVHSIWIVFPDPRPRDRDIKRRLTSPRFLEYYKRMLVPGGQVHLKTDNTGLFEYTLETLSAREDIADVEFTHDLDESSLKADHYGITTRFELKHRKLGEKIKYLKFKFAP